jgi:hypothetical protein
MGFLLGALLFGAGDTIYSAFQFQIPHRTSLKVTPDAANVWSWHKEILVHNTGGGLASHRERVLVDFDSNGRMDTEDSRVRVTVTDVQVVVLGIGPGTLNAWLSDNAGPRWYVMARHRSARDWQELSGFQDHLTTPLVLRPDSDLFVDLQFSNTLNPLRIVVNLIGRETTL